MNEQLEHLRIGLWELHDACLGFLESGIECSFEVRRMVADEIFVNAEVL